VAAPLAHESTGYEVVEGEPPELLGRNLVSAGHLLASATAFFFLSFVFAYFYLRSLNSAGLWKPKGVDTSLAWGTVVTACWVAAAGLVRLGLADHRAMRRPAWRAKGALALALGTAGLVIVLVIFMLLEREDLRDRLIRLVGHGHLAATTRALEDASTRVSRQLLLQTEGAGKFGTVLGGHFRVLPAQVRGFLLQLLQQFAVGQGGNLRPVGQHLAVE